MEIMARIDWAINEWEKAVAEGRNNCRCEPEVGAAPCETCAEQKFLADVKQHITALTSERDELTDEVHSLALDWNSLDEKNKELNDELRHSRSATEYNYNLAGSWESRHTDQVYEIIALEIDKAALKSTLDKLPVDAEGVLCGPGDRRWAWTHVGFDRKDVVLEGSVFWDPSGEPDWRIGFDLKAHSAGVCAGYSTEAAAKAASEEVQ